MPTTTWTDGTASVAEMAAAAKARGYEYRAITDHSRRVTMAHGLGRRQLRRQLDEIDRLSEKAGRLHDPQGDGIDVVVASVHYGLDLPREAQTARIIRAMDNRFVSIIGHPQAV
jgi:DNA polymerase (family 10)